MQEKCFKSGTERNQSLLRPDLQLDIIGSFSEHYSTAKLELRLSCSGEKSYSLSKVN